MSFQNQEALFITYTHPSQQRKKENRKAVSSYVSRSYRPTSKKIVFPSTNFRPFILKQERPEHVSTEDAVPKSKGPQAIKSRKSIPLQPSNDLLLCSPFQDPFRSYPIPYSPYISFLSDYFLRSLTPRFTPALGTEISRYYSWFNVAMNNAEMFHALIALSQMYYHIDTKGFVGAHWLALYHRGESLKLLRHKFETTRSEDSDASILTALWLMDVDSSHGDHLAFALHKRAKERMVASRGGIKCLGPALQDELLKSEFFLRLLLDGKLVCQENKNDVLVRFSEDYPPTAEHVKGLPVPFHNAAFKGLLSRKGAFLLHQLAGRTIAESHLWTSWLGNTPATPESLDTDEIKKVHDLVETRRPCSTDRGLCLALLIYIFNYHNQQLGNENHLDILDKIAGEMVMVKSGKEVSERECTIWTIIAIGACSAFSPWRLEIPFMSHIVEWMEDDSYLDQLTSCLRGYYLYGASKSQLKGLQKWRG